MTPQLYTTWKRIEGFFSHHHAIVFITVVAVLLGAAIFMLSQIIAENLAEATEVTPTIGAFDQKTVDKIKNLHISSGTSDAPLVFPSPRPNPFVE